MPLASAELNYLAPSTPSSLYRTGKLLMQRDLGGSDSSLQGVEFSKHEVMLEDGRAEHEGQGCTLFEHGFEVLNAPTADPELDVKRSFAGQQEQVRSSLSITTSVRLSGKNRRSAFEKGKRSKARRVLCTATTHSRAASSGCGI